MPAPTDSLDSNFFTITKSDTVPLRVPVNGIWVGGTGDLVVKNAQGETVTIAAVPAGTLVPLPGCSWVLNATTATSLVGIASRALR